MTSSLQLVSAPLDQGFNVGGAGWTQPVGLICLASFLREQFPNLQIDILDGEVIPIEQLEKLIGSELVGFGCTIGNYRNTLKLAELAKEKGCQTVLGGPHATALGSVILKNRSFVDCVVIGPGEAPLKAIIEQKKKGAFPNTWYRSNSKIQSGVTINSFNSISIPDYTFVDLEPYWKVFRQKFKDSQFKLPITIPSQRGCPRRQSKKACIFCSIPPSKWQSINPSRLWTLIENVKDRWNIDYIYDTADDFICNEFWLEELSRIKPDGNLPKLEICARSANLNNITTGLLYDIGVCEVFIGIETGSDKGLSSLNKGTTIKNNLSAARCLKDYGLYLYPGIILGIPDENEETVKQTLSHWDDLRHNALIKRFIFFMFTPLPGSISFNWMLKIEKFQRKYFEKDLFDLIELQKDWVSTFCKLDYEYLKEIVNKLNRE